MKNYKNILYTANPMGDNIEYQDRKYYRYMDKLYIPNIPSNLELRDVIALSEIRIKLDSSIINYVYTKDTISKLLLSIPNKEISTLLDFGSGNGVLSEVLREKEYSSIKHLIGVDACEYAVTQSLNNYHRNLNVIKTISETFTFDDVTPLFVKNDSVDCIISSFVMHFKIYDTQLSELYRVLKPHGFLVYNDYVYDKYPSNAKTLIKKLVNIGFTLLQEKTEFFLEPISNTLKPQRFMIFTKK